MAEATAPAAAPAGAEDDKEDDAEGFGMSDVLLDSVTKDEWKSIEQSLSHNKKTVAEMLKRACSQVRTKGELVLDESNGKFLGDMLTEMEDFATWCYKVRSGARLEGTVSARTPPAPHPQAEVGLPLPALVPVSAIRSPLSEEARSSVRVPRVDVLCASVSHPPPPPSFSRRSTSGRRSSL
jgi:hypothetical protein